MAPKRPNQNEPESSRDSKRRAVADQLSAVRTENEENLQFVKPKRTRNHIEDSEEDNDNESIIPRTITRETSRASRLSRKLETTPQLQLTPSRNLLHISSRASLNSSDVPLREQDFQLASKVEVWVQLASKDEDAFKVDFTDKMDFADLKKRINLERKTLGYSAGVVESIYSENSVGERCKLAVGAKVPFPAGEQSGSSYTNPYYFSIIQTRPASAPTASLEIDTISKKLDEIVRQRQGTLVSLVSPSVVQNHVEGVGGLLVKRFDPIDGLPSLFPNVLPSNLDEHQLIAVSTSTLNSFATMAGYESFVNSEEYKWIKSMHSNDPDSKNDYKPDGLITMNALFDIEQASGSNKIKRFRSKKCKGVSFLFGRGMWQIKDMLGPIFEYKTLMNAADRGKLYGYLQHLAYEDKHNVYRGILLDREQFFTVQCKNGACENAVLGSITDPGSLKFVTEFLSVKNRWLILLEGLCHQLDVELFRPKERKSAYLGAGRYGRCFIVREKKGARRILALKCVLLVGTDSGANPSMVNVEYEKMSSYGNVSIPHVMKVLRNSLVVVNETSAFDTRPMGIGYLMGEVGSQLPSKLTYYEKAVRSLASFHSHDPPIYHGDARVANVVVLSDNSVCWIDWMLCEPITGSRTKDLKTLVESICGSNVWNRVPRAYTLLQEYHEVVVAYDVNPRVGRDLADIAVELIRRVH